MPDQPHMTGLDVVDVTVVQTEPRDCENCGGSDLESLWRHRYDARTRAGIFRFDVNDVICRNCGFVFVSPVYAERDLSAYYGASYGAYTGAQLDYDFGKRLSFLSELTGIGGAFVEVGANRATRFHIELRRRFDKVILVDPNDSVESDFVSLAGLPSDSADLLAHYFVLEHVSSASTFLKDCSRVLKMGGIMICEVPDIEIYPRDPSALLLHEHTNHFSRGILKQIAAREGFEMIRVDAERCSRPFGFASAFRKAGRVAVGADTSEYERNRELVRRGLERLESAEAGFRASIERARTLEVHGQVVIFWAANAVMDEFLQLYSPGGNVTIVDNDPAKERFLCGRRVLLPRDAAGAISNADAIFIFTPHHSATILQQIGETFGKFFEPSQIHVVDTLGAEEK